MSYILFGKSTSLISLEKDVSASIFFNYKVPQIVTEMLSEHGSGIGSHPFIITSEKDGDNSDNLISEGNIFSALVINMKAITDVIPRLVGDGRLDVLFVSFGYDDLFQDVITSKSRFSKDFWNTLIDDGGWPSTRFLFEQSES